jgi:serine/threonine-protein kinase
MAPELARGEEADARTDVYALGAILYELLSGRPPYPGANPRQVLREVSAGPPAAPSRGVRPLPAELSALCAWTMAREPEDRPSDASWVAREVRAWLDGEKRREAALAVVAEADAQVPAAEALRERARASRRESADLLADVKAWEPEERKAAGWAKEDEAEALERRAALGELRRETLLQAALTHAADLSEAHAALAEAELAHHAAAEQAREPRRVTQAESRIAAHAAALPPGHPVAQRAVTYLRGDGALTLSTDPPGAEVHLYRYQLVNRRLVPELVRTLGETPLVELPLPMGSYLCVLRHPQRQEVRYPLHIGRGEHWHGTPPGEREPRPVHLPAHLEPDEVYVPAGWFQCGGDPSVASLARQRLWCEGLVVKRFPVTNREYLSFLDDLVAGGREEEALRYVPRARAGAFGEGAMEYGRDASGRFALQQDPDGDEWMPEWPVLEVHFGCAVAYARWHAERTGQPWRLPGELEWEKAARGVDGRFLPWGDHLDPSWCSMRDSRPSPLVAEVDSYPVDESVYGVRGMAGNVRDWCADRFLRAGPPTPEGRVRVPEVEAEVDLSPAAFRVLRGGCWSGVPLYARLADRLKFEPNSRYAFVGFRLARSEPRPA